MSQMIVPLVFFSPVLVLFALCVVVVVAASALACLLFWGYAIASLIRLSAGRAHI